MEIAAVGGPARFGLRTKKSTPAVATPARPTPRNTPDTRPYVLPASPWDLKAGSQFIVEPGGLQCALTVLIALWRRPKKTPDPTRNSAPAPPTTYAGTREGQGG